MKWTWLIFCFSVAALVDCPLATAADRADLPQLREKLTAALGEHFSFVEAKVRYEPVFRQRYWLAAIEARQAGTFSLRVAFRQFLPEAARRRDEQYLFEFTIAGRGTPRHVSRSAGHVFYDKLACVGDRILIPIRINDNDERHLFELLNVKVDKKPPAAKVDVQPPPFAVKNLAQNELALVAGEVSSFSNASKTAWYHSLDGSFEVSKPAKLNLRVFYEPAKRTSQRDEIYPFEFVERDQPVTVMVFHWQLQWFENGERTTRGNMGFYERVAQLRVGDSVSLRPLPYTAAAEHPDGKPYPTLVIEKQPFDPKTGPLLEALPDR